MVRINRENTLIFSILFVLVCAITMLSWRVLSYSGSTAPTSLPTPEAIVTERLVPVYTSRTPQDFTTLEELQSWVNDWRARRGDEITANIKRDPNYDCNDMSKLMQTDAYNDGYLMSIALTTQVVDGVVGGHALCIAQVGKAYYYVEPQNGDIRYAVSRR